MFHIVMTACPDEECANQIAHALVNSRLAACVNIVPKIKSIYRWQDKIESSQEYLLLIKSRKKLYQQIERMIGELHPYDVAEIISIAINHGSNDYLHWLETQTQTGHDPI